MQPNVGIVGLGAMGHNTAVNMERNGFCVAGFDVDPAKVKALRELATAGKQFVGCDSLAEMVGVLSSPRRIILLVPAEYTEDTIHSLAPQLASDDVLVDMGNSFYRDTERRQAELSAYGFSFIGCGVSGGYAGALLGPCLMPGGKREAWERMADVFAGVAAKVDGVPCTAYIGPGGAGHFLKMVHNGIYYGDSQLIAESYQIMSSMLGLTPEDLSRVFGEWNAGVLQSYLVQITADIFKHHDTETGKLMLDIIMDRAAQKGTGKWASQTSMDVGAPLGTINAALVARQVSFQKGERAAASRILPGPAPEYKKDARRLIDATRDALYVSKICSYAQGFTMLKMAGEEYGFGFNLEEVATIWRGGCLIRARLLDDIRRAFNRNPTLPNILIDPAFTDAVASRIGALRKVVSEAALHGIPVPAMSASLAYYDSYRTATLPANLIQAQRDYFGAHGFERLDRPGHFHREWQAG
jgi:6-phosphogluconate dehydrogenase